MQRRRAEREHLARQLRRDEPSRARDQHRLAADRRRASRRRCRPGRGRAGRRPSPRAAERRRHRRVRSRAGRARCAPAPARPDRCRRPRGSARRWPTGSPARRDRRACGSRSRDVEAVAEHGDGVDAHALQPLVVVDEADGPVLPARVLQELAREELARVAGADDQHVLDARVVAAERVARGPEPRPELDAAHGDQHQRRRRDVHRQRDVARVEEGVDGEEEDRHDADGEREVDRVDDAGELPRRAVDAKEEVARDVRQRDEPRGRREEADRLTRHVAVEAQRQRRRVRREHDRRIEQQHRRQAQEVAECRREAAVHGVQDSRMGASRGWGWSRRSRGGADAACRAICSACAARAGAPRYAAIAAKSSRGPRQRRCSAVASSGTVVRRVARSLKRHRELALLLQRRREHGGAAYRDAPVRRIGRDRFDAGEARQHRRRRLRAPAGEAREAVRAVADERQVVGDGRRRHAELRDHAVLVADNAGAAVELHDLTAHDALRQVFVRRADQHLRGVAGRDGRRRGERVVRLVLDHRPDGDAERRERLLEDRELRAQLGVDAGAGLVAGPEAVAERLHDVVGRDAEVRGAAAEHRQHRREDAAHRRHLVPSAACWLGTAK